MPHTNVALIFDFDDTLVPDSTSTFLAEHGINPDEFWRVRQPELIRQGYDPTNAWLHLLLDEVGPEGNIGPINNQDLREFGTILDSELFDGLPQFFEDVEDIVDEYRDVSVEFYVISGGLREIILGTSISEYIDEVYACELASRDSDYLNTIKRSVNFTEKTRYLFEINKGVEREDTLENPYIVNQEIHPESRRVAWEDIIYVGDGLTDVPCFSLISKNGGVRYGVFDEHDQSSKQRAIRLMEAPDRVEATYLPDFTEDSSLGNVLRSKVRDRCLDATASQAI